MLRSDSLTGFRSCIRPFHCSCQKTTKSKKSKSREANKKQGKNKEHSKAEKGRSKEAEKRRNRAKKQKGEEAEKQKSRKKTKAKAKATRHKNHKKRPKRKRKTYGRCLSTTCSISRVLWSDALERPNLAAGGVLVWFWGWNFVLKCSDFLFSSLSVDDIVARSEGLVGVNASIATPPRPVCDVAFRC